MKLLLLVAGLLGPIPAAQSPQASGETQAVSTIKSIMSAQAFHRRTKASVGYACTIEELVKVKALTGGIEGGKPSNGYIFSLDCPTQTRPQGAYRAFGKPEATGRPVCTDQTLGIRAGGTDVASCLADGEILVAAPAPPKPAAPKPSATAKSSAVPAPSVSAAPPAKAGTPAHVMVTPADIQWADGPPSLPAGAKAALIEGDPKNPGAFTMRLKLPANYKIPPHWHPADEHVTVISGTFIMGMAETFDESKGHPLPVGSFAVMPAKTRHFAFTKEETVVQLHGTGPWAINYVNGADDPRKK